MLQLTADFLALRRLRSPPVYLVSPNFSFNLISNEDYFPFQRSRVVSKSSQASLVKMAEASLSLREILKRHEEQLMDFDQNICLLCKRVFLDSDQIKRHRSLSKLHSSRLKRLRQRLFSEEQLDRIERKEREASYRDRAKERRLKYGQPDKMIQLEPMRPGSGVRANPKGTTSHKRSSASTRAEAKPLEVDNKGAALMAKMGWRQGVGLGKSNEGMTDVIKLDTQVGTSGLGSKPYRVDPNLSYKDAVKQVMYQRYHEISSEEEP